MSKPNRVSRRSALKLGVCIRGTAAGAHPHRPGGRQAVGRLLGPLGAVRQCHAEAAMRRLGGEEPGRGERRFHHLGRQQARPDPGRRGAGGHRPRRAALLPVGDPPPRRQARAGGRRGAAADRQERQGQQPRRISRTRGRALARRAVELGRAGQGAMRARQRAEERRRHRCDEDVPGEGRVHPRNG